MNVEELVARIGQARSNLQAARDSMAGIRGIGEEANSQPEYELCSTDIAVVMEQLEQSALDQLEQDAQQYGEGNFPPDYYETLSRSLFEQALRTNGGNYEQAILAVHALANDQDNFSVELQDKYEDVVGTDSENGWDKVRHFSACAYLQYKRGTIITELFSYGKEAMDEVERWLGKDPEGYSYDDRYANIRGQAFGEEIYRRESNPIPDLVA